LTPSRARARFLLLIIPLTIGYIDVHELSIAQSLLDIVVQEAARHGVERVIRVGVKVGAFSAVVPSALKFSFDLIKENTVAAEAELAIEEVPLTGLCQDCGQELEEMDSPIVDCPACGSNKIELTQGRELTISFIETDDDETA
jgi:hydrogenase nickel incorporation protein HypA/HybF